VSDSQLSPHDLALIDAVAERVLELLEERNELRGGLRFVSADELAALLGRSREWVYDHADELGGRRIGTGRRPRLWFDVDQAVSGRRTSEGSQRPDSPAPAGRSRRRRQRTPGSQADLLPIGGRNGQGSS
jgi:hypothetical protein